MVARDGDGALVERARAGALTALAHLPPCRESVCARRTCKRGPGTGWTVVNAGIWGRDSRPLGLLRVVVAEPAPPPLVRAVEAIAAHAAVVAGAGRAAPRAAALLQPTLHRLRGRPPAEPEPYRRGYLTHVVGLLVRTLHFPHCAVMLIDGDELMPAGDGGPRSGLGHSRRLPLADTFAGRVLDAGAAAQFDDIRRDGRPGAPAAGHRRARRPACCARR